MREFFYKLNNSLSVTIKHNEIPNFPGTPLANINYDITAIKTI